MLVVVLGVQRERLLDLLGARWLESIIMDIRSHVQHGIRRRRVWRSRSPSVRVISW